MMEYSYYLFNEVSDVISAAVKPERSPLRAFSEGAMNPLGLAGLNKLMLKYANAEISTIMRICSDPRRYPIMIHCLSGQFFLSVLYCCIRPLTPTHTKKERIVLG